MLLLLLLSSFPSYFFNFLYCNLRGEHKLVFGGTLNKLILRKL